MGNKNYLPIVSNYFLKWRRVAQDISTLNGLITLAYIKAEDSAK